MAKSDAVWGIDIGNCSLKALRLRPEEVSSRVTADAFDFIEYPKILTQPGADPVELVNEALQQFLSRNTVRGDQVAISVSGQNGLARFIKLPPVEAKKIPDIVKYEARQQIPFDLDDVVWDYQRMGGGAEEEGFAMETEIGLFAMKRDQVFRALEPLNEAAIAVDYVQLTPLALYNFMRFDQLTELPSADEYDPDNPPPSIVLLSMGTDASDLVVTNGFRVWQRSIPLGGNHFTKALSKDLKLTFAKAEHLKRNAATAEDPKAVFQAMRPVFNDLLTQIQRSVGYFMSIDRAAKIERVVAMGNPIKLPGLRRYLAQNLGYDVVRLEGYQNLVGPEVLSAPAFRENHLCFGVAYGLALQGLKKGSLRTNLLPREIVKDRVVKAKKPWAVAAAAVLMLACAISLASWSRALATVDPEKFKSAQSQADSTISLESGFKGQADEAKKAKEVIDKVGQNLVSNVEGRLLWLELLKAITDNLPRDPQGRIPNDLRQRNQLFIEEINCQALSSGADAWLTYVKENQWLLPEDLPPPGSADGTGTSGTTDTAATTTAATTTATSSDASAAGTGGPTLYLVQLRGYHFHNLEEAGPDQGAEWVRRKLLVPLRNGQTMLGQEVVSLKDLGVSSPALIDPRRPRDVFMRNPFASPEQAMMASETEGMASGMRPVRTGMPPGASRGPYGMSSGIPQGSYGGGSGNPYARMPPGMGARGVPGTSPAKTAPAAAGTEAANEQPLMISLTRFDFTVQFVWEPTPKSVRDERLQKKLEEEKAKAGVSAAPAEGTAPSGDGAPVAPVAPGTPPAAAPPAVPGQPAPNGTPAPAAAAPAPEAAAPGATAPPAGGPAPAAPAAPTPPPPAQP